MKKQDIVSSVLAVQKHYGHAEPPVSAYAESLNLSEAETIRILDELTADGSISPKRPKVVPKAKRPYKKKTKLQKFLSDLPMWMIRITMGVIGLGASVMSCYYTATWLMEFLSPFLSYFLSFLMIVFSVFAFQTIIFLVKERGSSAWPLAVLFSILWLIVAFFSMGSTVAGQYNARMSHELTIVEESKTDTVSRFVLDTLIAERDRYDEELESHRRDRTAIQNVLDEFDTIEEREEKSGYYRDMRTRLYVTNTAIGEIEERLNDLNQKILDKVETGEEMFYREQKAQVYDFYTWLSGVITVDSDSIQFVLSVFPAIFIDVIAPLGVAIGFFLHRKRRGSKKK